MELYDSSVAEVYSYLLRRCGRPEVAEDLTSETFLAAVDAARKPEPPELSSAWLIGVARHKLMDHWRAAARSERRVRVAAEVALGTDDPWEAQLDVQVAWATLGKLTPSHRTALVFRYIDGLSVPEIAPLIGRSVHGTEALLVRARTAFRHSYETGEEYR